MKSKQMTPEQLREMIAAHRSGLPQPADLREALRAKLDRLPAVVQAVQGGASLRKAASAAGVSINTVRKVKKAMGRT